MNPGFLSQYFGNKCTSGLGDDLVSTGPNYYTGFLTKPEETMEAHKQQTKNCFVMMLSVNKKLDVGLLI